MGYKPVAYDPVENKYINVCESEAFSEAMAVISIMVQQGLLVMDTSWYETLDYPESLDYKVASVMGTSYYPEYFNGYVLGDYWPCIDGKAGIPVWVNQKGLAVLKDTTGVAEKFNKMYGIAASGLDGYMDLLAGIEGKSYDIGEDHVNLKMVTSDGGDNPIIGSGFCQEELFYYRKYFKV